MGSSPIIPGCWRVGLILQGATGLKAEMTFAVNDADVIRDSARATTIAAAFKSWWSTSMRSRCSSTWSLVQVYVLDVDSAVGTSLNYVSGLPLAGTGSATPAAQNAAAIITWNTGSRGRSFRGRTFVAGMQASDIYSADGTQVLPAAVTAYSAAAAALITAIAAVDVSNNTFLGVASNKLLLNTRITTGTCRTYLGTQRRRVSSP